MDSDKTDRISRRAYELWEAEGHPHGRHEDHWRAAEQEIDQGSEAPQGCEVSPDGGSSLSAGSVEAHPGMMGDGTEEQNLGQPGNPSARITAEEVEAAFAEGKNGEKAE